MLTTSKGKRMSEGVKEQETAKPVESQVISDSARENFRRLEAAKDEEREKRLRAEMHNEAMQKELAEIKMMLQPKEKDPLDDVTDYIDPNVFKAKLEKERKNFIREAENIANKTYDARQQQDKKNNFMQRLKSDYNDYDQVMNEANVADLEKRSPTFLQAVLKIDDDYERRRLTYQYLKEHPKAKPVEDIKEKIAENAKNPYHIPSGTGTPSAMDFDVKSQSARDAAYAKLKAAQKRAPGR
jgi:hypothetical protein